MTSVQGRGSFQRSAGVVLAASGILAFFSPLGCAPGEIRLRESVDGEGTGAGTSMDSTGGQGGSTSGSGDVSALPCLVTQACFTFCDEDRPGCSMCDSDLD